MIFKRATLVFASLIASMLFSFGAVASDLMKCDAVEKLPTINADVTFIVDAGDMNGSDAFNYFTSKEKASDDSLFFAYSPDIPVHFNLSEIETVTGTYEFNLDSSFAILTVTETVPFNQLE